MQLIAYTRLSQANEHEGESHAGQLERMEAWANDEGHEVVAHHRDTCSGENGPDERPGFLDALVALDEGTADGIVVSALDRLARKLHVQEALLGTVWSREGTLYEVGLGEVPQDDPSDPARALIRQVMGAVAQYERAMIVKRMGDGRRRAIANGRSIGPTPWGWAKDPDDPGQLHVVPELAPTIRHAAELREGGASLRQVAAYLVEETNRPWSATQASRLLDRAARYPVSPART